MARMPVARRRVTAAVALFTAACMLASCGRPSRAEMRQERLDTFRNALPSDVRAAFDTIDGEQGYGDVGRMITAARLSDPLIAASLDSIRHAELIDFFSDSEMVRFFRIYFADAIRDGTVPEP
jgi:hypothetical protein